MEIQDSLRAAAYAYLVAARDMMSDIMADGDLHTVPDRNDLIAQACMMLTEMTPEVVDIPENLVHNNPRRQDETPFEHMMRLFMLLELAANPELSKLNVTYYLR